MPNNEQLAVYQQASIKTANDLRTLTKSTVLSQLSRLSLPEIEYLTDEVARVVPAGNIPGIILSGLARLGGREIPHADTEKQIGMLFKGVRQMLDKAIYGTFFAGPAAILYGYQQCYVLLEKTQIRHFRTESGSSIWNSRCGKTAPTTRTRQSVFING